MKTLFLGLSFLLASSWSISASVPESPSTYIDNLISLDDYAGTVDYSVLIPQAEDPITYSMTLHSTANPPSYRLAPCSYLIEWTPSREGEASGFSAYIDGAHYRYRDNRLQEYHMEWDSIPFTVGNGGVQCNAQFVDVLPQFIGKELQKLVNDTNFIYTFTPDTLYNGHKVAVIEGRLMFHGYVSKESTYIFDPSSLLPIAIEYENNPGSISEQSVSVKFTSSADEAFPLASENDLLAMYPEVFEKYRESNFRVENLPGTQLPTFTAPASHGERYVHHRGEPFDSNLIIILVDDSGAYTTATIDAARKASERSPKAFGLVIAYVTSDREKAVENCGQLNPGEELLSGARSLARDCGVTSFPTMLYVGSDGIVKDVTLGYSQDLEAKVLQTATLSF
ncbi:MAG: hypothetical protein NC082_03725 [Clostridiales bacterium]|nr:hypothetical protein [Clostridiales bacterium]